MLKQTSLFVVLLMSNLFQIIIAQYIDVFDESDFFEPSKPENVQKILVDILNGRSPTTISNLSLIETATDYDPLLRPTGDNKQHVDIIENGSLLVTILLSLKQIVSLDEKNQILTTNFYLMLKWGDPRLMWNPLEYNNISSIIVPANKFWLPDLAIMNSALTSAFINYPSNQNLIITNDGFSYLTLSLPSQSTRCKLDIFKYPFDKQTCNIIIGSWSNTRREIKFTRVENQTKTLRNYIENSIWSLKLNEEQVKKETSRLELVNIDLESDDENLLWAEDLIFSFSLKRKPLYIMINGITPCFVLNCIILLSFWIPYAQQINLCKKFRTISIFFCF